MTVAASGTGPQAALTRYAESHFGDLSDTTNLAETMFTAGFREAVTAMVQFQDLPEQMRRIERYVDRVCKIFEDAGVVR